MKVVIDNKAYQKIMFWVHQTKLEISGMGMVKKLADGTMYVYDAFLLEQENTTGDTEINATALAKAEYEKRNEEGTLSYWWHSHHDMNVFWSGTDEAAIKQLGQHGWFLQSVFNKKADQLTCYYQKGDEFFPEVRLDKLAISLTQGLSAEDRAECLSEYQTKCTEKTYAYQTKKGKKKKGKSGNKAGETPTLVEDTMNYEQRKKTFLEDKQQGDYLEEIPESFRDALYDDFYQSEGRHPFFAWALLRHYNDYYREMLEGAPDDDAIQTDIPDETA